MGNSGNSGMLRRSRTHPYIGKKEISTPEQSLEALALINKGRENRCGPTVEVTYWFLVDHEGEPLSGLASTAKMILDHGTLKPWDQEGDPAVAKPANYNRYMSWATDVRLLGSDRDSGTENGLITIVYPLQFFDARADHKVPLAQLFMAIASEPFSAFSFYQGARIVDVTFPPEMLKRFPRRLWPHARVRAYLGIGEEEPIIGTIVKPKTGLTPELFSRSVVEAALAGARFTKADENMHLTPTDLSRYVSRVVKDLEASGFDLGRSTRPKGRRFLFAPHITTDADKIREYARIALDAGANALMFSPYYGGGFQLMAEIIEQYDVPVYAHTAGMNVITGSPTWGIDPRVMYVFAGLFGAAFMQLTAAGGYLKPDDIEKGVILEALAKHGLQGVSGMTLAIAGGLGPSNIGRNARAFGKEGRMFLAGTSVYSHPDGPAAGVKAIDEAYSAYLREGTIDVEELRRYAVSRGYEGKELLRSLG